MLKAPTHHHDNIPLPQNANLRPGFLRNDLLPQHTHELRTADALVSAVLDEQSLGPESETGLAVLADEVERRDDNGATALAAVVAALLDDCTHALVHLRVDDGQSRLALLKLVLVLGAEDVGDESGDGVAAEPQELSLTIVDEVETVRHKVARRKVEGWRHDDRAGLGIREASIIGHVVQRVQARVDVLNQEGQGQGGKQAKSC